MRFFYDQPSRVSRARTLLSAADFGLLGSAIVFAGGTLFDGTAWVDIFLLLTWVVFPRLLAEGLRNMQWPRNHLRMVHWSALIIFGCITCGLLGFEILNLTHPDLSTHRNLLFLLMLSAWFSSLLLLFPHSYRLFDGLCLTLFLVGVIEKQPGLPVFFVLVFGSLLLSAAVRHQIFNIAVDDRTRPPNLQNSRVSATFALLVALVIFVLAFGLAWRFLPDWSKVFGNDPDAELPPITGIENVVSTEYGDRRIGTTPRMQLHDLETADNQPVPIFSVRVAENTRWEPDILTLWRAQTYRFFAPGEGEWSDPPTYQDANLHNAGQIPFLIHPEPRNFVNLQITFLRAAAAGTVQSLIRPYFAASISLPAGSLGRRRILLSESFDVVAEPPLPPSSSYEVRLALLGRRGGMTEPPPESSHLEIPEPERVGVDLKHMAKEIFGNTLDLDEKLRSLRTFFETNYRYVRADRWRDERRALAHFLNESRKGNCTYFATASCLLLRAGGVPTRAAGGYISQDYDEGRGVWLVRSDTAHAWGEYWREGVGWQPFDATQWVVSDTDELIPAIEEDPEDGESGEGTSQPHAATPLDRWVNRRPANSSAGLWIVAALLGVGVLFLFRRGVGDVTSPTRPHRPKLTNDVADNVRAADLILRIYDSLQHELRRVRRHRPDAETPAEHARRHSGRNDRLDKALLELKDLVYHVLCTQRPVDFSHVRAARSAARIITRELR